MSSNINLHDDLQVTKSQLEGNVEVLRQECCIVLRKYKISTATLSGVEEALRDRKEEIDCAEKEPDIFKNDLQNLSNKIEELKRIKDDITAENKGHLAMLIYAKEEQTKVTSKTHEVKNSRANILTQFDKKFKLKDEIAKKLSNGEAIYCCFTDSTIVGVADFGINENIQKQMSSSKTSVVSINQVA